MQRYLRTKMVVAEADELMPAQMLFERPCPLCGDFMTWVDDEAGYYCKTDQRWVCIPRARGTLTDDRTWTKVEQ